MTPGVSHTHATNIIEREEVGAQPEAIGLGQVAVIVTIIFFIFGHLFAPLCGVHTGLVGELFAGLFAAVLLIINALIQACGGDVKRGFGEVVRAPATGATTRNFSGLYGPRRGEVTGRFLYGFNGFSWPVLTATTIGTVAVTVGAIENSFTCVGFHCSGVSDTPDTLFNEINIDEMLLNIFECLMNIIF